VTGDVLILGGPPGAGKTTVAAILASGAPRPTVHLETDHFFRAIRTGFVLPYLPEAEPQNQVVMRAVVASVAAFAAGGYDVIVEGIIGPWFLPHFDALAGVRIDFVVLYPSLEVTLARAASRAAGKHLRDPAPISGLHAAFGAFAAPPASVAPPASAASAASPTSASSFALPGARNTIDTSGEEPSLTASRVRRGLATTRFRLHAPGQPPDPLGETGE
jgi:cytidylate kinase